jgi:hypothetical protein
MNNRAPQAIPAQPNESKGTNLARELFTSNFWMSGLAMLKYIPRAFRVKQLDGMAFFTNAKHEEFQNRVLRITPSNPGQWGTMNVSHCITSIWRVAAHWGSTNFPMRAISHRERCFDGFWWTGSRSSP